VYVHLRDQQERMLWAERQTMMTALAGGLKNKDKSPIEIPDPHDKLEEWEKRLHAPLDIDIQRAAALRLVSSL
jgi:hypothetical protein